MKNRSFREALIYGGVGLAILVALAAMWIVQAQKPKQDKELCFHPVTEKAVFLVDLSDKVPLQTRKEIRSRILKYAEDKLPANTFVTLFEVSEMTKDSFSPRFRSCRPEKEGRALTENPHWIRKRYEGFLADLASSLEKFQEGSEGTPLTRAVMDVHSSEYLKDSTTSHLLVFSDFLENSDGLSLYDCRDGEGAIRRYKEIHGGRIRIRPELRDTHVTLNIIPRAQVSEANRKCIATFWNWFFGDTKFSNPKDKIVLDVQELPGG